MQRRALPFRTSIRITVSGAASPPSRMPASMPEKRAVAPMVSLPAGVLSVILRLLG